MGMGRWRKHEEREDDSATRRREVGSIVPEVWDAHAADHISDELRKNCVRRSLQRDLSQHGGKLRGGRVRGKEPVHSSGKAQRKARVDERVQSGLEEIRQLRLDCSSHVASRQTFGPAMGGSPVEAREDARKTLPVGNSAFARTSVHTHI